MHVNSSFCSEITAELLKNGKIFYQRNKLILKRIEIGIADQSIPSGNMVELITENAWQ
jgi:hypothetical protein